MGIVNQQLIFSFPVPKMPKENNQYESKPKAFVFEVFSKILKETIKILYIFGKCYEILIFIRSLFYN